jgi:hypothetical protein
MESQTLSVSIDRPAAEAYEFLAQPQNFPKWARGAGSSLRPHGADWVVDTPEGAARVRFSERNAHGVLDHQVTPPRGAPVYVPLRVIANGRGCNLVLTVLRRADAAWVLRDLHAAKRILEAK